MSDAVLLAMQSVQGFPRSPNFELVSDPLLPPRTRAEMLSHFFEGLYDLREESHLSRLLGVILGDTGVGQLRKRYTYAHLSQFLLTTHYHDLDRLYADVFGLKRFVRETLDLNPYIDAATDAEWEAIDAADAAYRAKVEAFSRAIAWGGTPTGMVLAAEALLGDQVRVYESYSFIDETEVYAPVSDPGRKTYADLEESTYAELSQRTFAEIEGGPVMQRVGNSRGEFIVRPLREITNEEQYHLTRVLDRLKPSEALMTIDARPAQVHIPVPVTRAVSASNYWHVRAEVHPTPEVADLYDRYDENRPVEQPKLAFSSHQDEEWSYNADVVSVTSYAEDEDGTVVQDANFERVQEADQTVDYRPELAIEDAQVIVMGKAVSDGVLIAPVADRAIS